MPDNSESMGVMETDSESTLTIKALCVAPAICSVCNIRGTFPCFKRVTEQMGRRSQVVLKEEEVPASV